MQKSSQFQASKLALLIGFFLLLPVTLFAQGRPGGGGHFMVPNIPEADAMEILERFRSLRLEHDFSVKFVLKHMPRRGDMLVRTGRMWGSYTEEGPVSLFEIFPLGEKERSQFLLVRNGRNPRVWWSESPDQPLREIPPADWFKPLIEGFLYSPFDAMMPFIYWPDARYRESKRLLGRRTHVFRIPAPEEFRKQFPDILRVELALDAQFDALIQALLIGNDSERALRSFNVLSFKKIDEQYIVGSTEVRDEIRRDRTLFEITDAILNIQLPAELFHGEGLPRVVDIPASEYIPVR
jgi:hypothetical protein